MISLHVTNFSHWGYSRDMDFFLTLSNIGLGEICFPVPDILFLVSPITSSCDASGFILFIMAILTQKWQLTQVKFKWQHTLFTFRENFFAGCSTCIIVLLQFFIFYNSSPILDPQNSYRDNFHFHFCKYSWECVNITEPLPNPITFSDQWELIWFCAGLFVWLVLLLKECATHSSKNAVLEL